jgi:hypothetical protein
MLAKGGKIIADDARKVRFHLEDEQMDPNSGKPVANVVVYESEDGPERYRVSYRSRKRLSMTNSSNASADSSIFWPSWRGSMARTCASPATCNSSASLAASW